MGLLGTASAVGTALGPSLGGVLIPFTGWSGIFWVQVPLAVVALLLVLYQLPASGGLKKMRGATVGFTINGTLARSLLVNFLVASVMMTTLVVGPFYLSLTLGLEPAMVGLVMMVGPIISIVSGVPSGRLVDTIGSRPVLLTGLGLLAAGTLLLASLPAAVGLSGYVIAIFVLTPGYQLFQAANNTQTLANVAGEHRGRISGLLGLSRNIGLVAGAWGMGAIFAFGVGGNDLIHADPSAIAHGLGHTFLVASAMMVLGVGIALLK